MFDIPKTMQAAVYRGVDDVRIETVPVPRIQSGELLVKVAVCGVCPTDIKKIQYGMVPPPKIFGHEMAGTIVRVGARTKGFRVGDRVALHHHVPCFKCHVCRHRNFAQCAHYKRTGTTAGFGPAGGGFAEYVRVMSFVLPGVVKIPARNSFEEGAMLEPVNTVLKAINRLNLLRGDVVWVAGQGPIGLMFTRLLSLRGVHVVATDLFKRRLAFARRFGAWKTFVATDARFIFELQRQTARRGPDAVVLAVCSNGVLKQAFQIVRRSGQIMLFAHTRRGEEASVDLSDVCFHEIDLVGSYSSDFTLQGEVAKLVFSRRMDVRALITHRYDLREAARAIKSASNPNEDSLKIVVEP